MNKYEWKIRSLAKGIDANLALQELERIESVYGVLSAENILSESRNDNAILHPLFEWQEDVAAEKYRMQQARFILNNIHIKVIKNGNSLLIPVYEVVTINKERGYRSINVMTQSDVDQVKRATLKDLASIKAKLESYEDFETTRLHIQNALQSLDE